MPDEALSSWIARIGARYDLDGVGLIRHLLGPTANPAAMLQSLDHRAVAPLERALAAATGQPAEGFAAHRLFDATIGSKIAWPRTDPAWCPLCVLQDVASSGEVYARVAWRYGAILLCEHHQCLLIAECPRCFDKAGYRLVKGRLRIWCQPCGAGADTMLPADRIPFWPFGTPQQHRACKAVSLSAAARPLLQSVQTDLLAVLAGTRLRRPWLRCLKRDRIFDVLRRLDRDLPAARLIAALAGAVDAAGAADHGIVLPELAVEPALAEAPVKRRVPARRRRDDPSPDG